MLLGSVCLALILAVPLMVACAAPAPPAPEVFNWKLSCGYPPGDSNADICAPHFIDFVKEKSNGRLNITRSYEGEICPPDEIMTAVGDGVCEMGYAIGPYWAGVEPCLGWDVLPFICRSQEDLMALTTSSALLEILSDAYGRHNCYFLGNDSCGPYPVIFSTVPIHTLDDFKGLKSRCTGYTAALFEEMGMSTTFIPGSEIYMALKLGTVEVAVWDYLAIDNWKWGELMACIVQPPIVAWCAQDMIINMDAWCSLPDDLQQVLRLANADLRLFAVSMWPPIIDEALGPWADKYGYTVNTLPDEDVETLQEIAYNKVWPSFAEQDEYSAKIVEVITDWYKEGPGSRG